MSVAVHQGRGEVSVEPFREAFLRLEATPKYGRSGETGFSCKDAANTVAERLGWYDRGRPDGPRVRRVLGLRSYQIGGSSRGAQRMVTRKQITEETALRLCDALGLDPVDFDL